MSGYVRLDERGAGFMGCNWGGALGSSPFNHTFLAASSLPFPGVTFSCPNEGPPNARGALPSCGDP